MKNKAATNNTTIIRFIENHLHQIEIRQFLAGENAVASRDMKALLTIANESGLWANYYRGVYFSLNGQADYAEDILSEVAASCSPMLKGRVLLSRAGNRFRQGRIGESIQGFNNLRYYTHDPLTALQACKMRAVILGLAGQHSKALDELQRGIPLLHSIPLFGGIREDYLNSLTVELLETGSLDSARQLAAHIQRSALLPAYPEWQSTVTDERMRPATAFVCATTPNPKIIPFPERRPVHPAIRLMRQQFRVSSLVLSLTDTNLLTLVENLIRPA